MANKKAIITGILRTRCNLLEMLKPAQLCMNRYYSKDVGSGLMKKIKRLVRYRLKYFRYSLAKSGLYSSQLALVRTFWGGKIFVSLLDAYDASIFYCGICSEKEYKLTKFLIKNIKKNDVFYDIGAHLGFYSLLVNECIDNGEIHAFEPAPKTFYCLAKNISINKKIKVFLNKFALSDKIGEAEFFDKSVSSGGGSSTMVRKVIEGKDASSYQNITVKTNTLDEYVKSHFNPTILKIDVEGAESQVLEGGRHILSQRFPIIAMEVWGGEQGRRFSSPAINMLYSFGYKSYKITEDGDLDYLEKIQPERDVSGKWDNFVFKKFLNHSKK